MFYIFYRVYTYLGNDNDGGYVRKYGFDVTPGFGGHQSDRHRSGVSPGVPHRYPELERLSWYQHPVQVHVRLAAGRRVWRARQIFNSYHVTTEICLNVGGIIIITDNKRYLKCRINLCKNLNTVHQIWNIYMFSGNVYDYGFYIIPKDFI